MNLAPNWNKLDDDDVEGGANGFLLSLCPVSVIRKIIIIDTFYFHFVLSLTRKIIIIDTFYFHFVLSL